MDVLEQEVKDLYQRYSGPLLRYAESLAPESARDALQETFLRYFVERRYGRAITNPQAWLYQVLRNFVLDARKKASSQRELPGIDLERIPSPHASPESLMDRDSTAAAIRGGLSGRELECVRLRAGGMSYEEISQKLSLRPGTVGALLSRAAKKLRSLSTGSQGFAWSSAADALRYLDWETARDTP